MPSHSVSHWQAFAVGQGLKLAGGEEHTQRLGTLTTLSALIQCKSSSSARLDANVVPFHSAYLCGWPQLQTGQREIARAAPRSADKGFQPRPLGVSPCARVCPHENPPLGGPSRLARASSWPAEKRTRSAGWWHHAIMACAVACFGCPSPLPAVSCFASSFAFHSSSSLSLQCAALSVRKPLSAHESTRAQGSCLFSCSQAALGHGIGAVLLCAGTTTTQDHAEMPAYQARLRGHAAGTTTSEL